MAADSEGPRPGDRHRPFARSYCGPPPRLTPAASARNRHYAESVERKRRVINIAASIAAAVSFLFSVIQLITQQGGFHVGVLNFIAASIFACIPLLHRVHPLVAPLTLVFASFVSLTVICVSLGTGSGLQFYFLVSATVALLVFGTDHVVLASVLAAVNAALVIFLEFTVPNDTGSQPEWSLKLGFATSVVTAFIIVAATLLYALRAIERAESAMDAEYERSEELLTNILPGTVAERLKNPSTTIIADKYEDASVLFADIAGYTERASQTPPADLVEFLNRLYSEFDALVDRHGLEKIKTSGDSYIVVSGVPEPRADHLEALGCLALRMRDALAGLADPRGREVPLRIGIGAGPVVAGVVGTRRFFYDVWGDAVNVASRMESTGVVGRIQVPEAVYARLDSEVVLEARGEVDVKGKGVMRTWFLNEQRDGASGLPGLVLADQDPGVTGSRAQ